MTPNFQVAVDLFVVDGWTVLDVNDHGLWERPCWTPPVLPSPVTYDEVKALYPAAVDPGMVPA